LVAPRISLAVFAGKVKLEQVAFCGATYDGNQELVSAETSLGHPRFTDEPALSIYSESNEL